MRKKTIIHNQSPQSLQSNQLPDSTRQKILEKFQKKIGYTFNDISLLNISLTHSSYSNEFQGKENNERLEFLGDLVLGLIIGDYLLGRKPSYSEGCLSFIKSILVNKKTLATLAEEIGLGDILQLGKGERLSGGKNKASLLANALEALIGAIYRDGGLENSKKFIYKYFDKEIHAALRQEEIRDYKSLLQEKSQKEYNLVPVYQVTGFEGPDHDRTYNVRVLVNDRVLGSGKGKTKKEAEQAAAGVALSRISPWESAS